MSRTGDHPDEMRAQPVLDDQEIADLLQGEQVNLPADLHELARFVGEIRHTVAGPMLGPAPAVGSQLAAIFDRGAISDSVGKITSQGAGTARRRLAHVAALAAGLTFATAGAAAADLLPRAAQDGVAALVERVTPLDIPDSHERPGSPAGDPRPSPRPDDQGAGKDVPPEVTPAGTGTGTGRVGNAGMGQGGVGGALPESVSPSADDAEGKDSAQEGERGDPRPPTSRANQEQAPAAQDHRRDPSIPPPGTPAVEENRGTAHRQ